jgi:hypothetical protein
VEHFSVVLCMPRKKWTARSHVDDAVLRFRAKKKWQIALRRYIIEENPCFNYAPYFGLDIGKFRNWIELQFDGDLNWANFSEKWQLEHVVPLSYFDFENEGDLRLCWNFINIRVEPREKERKKEFSLGSAKSYFSGLFERTGYPPAGKMVEKLEKMHEPGGETHVKQQHFLNLHKYHLTKIADFSDYEFDRLNYGNSLVEILDQRESLNKFR